MSLRAWLVVIVLGQGLVPSAGLASPPGPACLDLPAPDPTVSLQPIALGAVRPAFPLPKPPPPPHQRAAGAPVPLPGFVTASAKPFPAVPDPGAFSCAMTAFRGAEALVDCGVHLAMRGDLLGARRSLEQSEARDAGNARAPTASLWLGEIALREGRWDAAEQAYRAALARGAQGQAAHDATLGLAWALLRRGEWSAPLEALARAGRDVGAPRHAHMARLLEGVGLALAGRSAEALAALEAVDAGQLPGTLAEEWHFWRGVALGRRGEHARALEALDRFLAVSSPAHPLRADALLHGGWIALEAGAPAEAARRFLLVDPAEPRAEVRLRLQAGLARARLDLGDVAGVRETARRFVTESSGDPLVVPILLLIADAVTRSGATSEGIAVYRHVLGLAVAPALEDYARYRLGEALERDGRVDEARQEYARLRDAGKDEGIAQRAAYALGLLALDVGDPAAARREGEALLRAGAVSELREAVLLLAAEGAARDGDAGRAAALFHAALADYPDSPRAARIRLALGWARLHEGDPELALREWRRVLGAGDPETGALAGLAAAEAALRMRRDAEALDALRVIEGLPVPEPLREAALLDRGVLTVRAGAWKEAIGILEPLAPRIADPARQSLARRALGTARYHLGEHAGASQEFRRSLHLARAESSAWIGLGLSALAQRRLAEAEEAFAHARASADPPTAAAAAHGLVLVAIQRGDEAAFATRAAAFVDADPAHEAVPGLLCRLAATAVSRGEIERAERWLTRLVLDHPRSEHAREALRHFGAATEGRPGVRRRVYDAILARPVPDWLRLDALFGLAEAGLALGDAADAQRAAEAFLREAPAGDPRIPTAFARLVRIHEAQGRHGLALRTAESFLARFPDEPLAPRVELVRGRLLVAEGRWESAQRSLEAARDRGEPEVAAEAHFWLGETLRARGDLGAATAVYLGASRLYPQTMWAARGLQGAARSYLDRGMPAEAAALLREITVQPAAEPALVDWARDGLRRLGAEPPPEARDHIRRVPGARP